jgi:PAS domain S-box-containing protein
MITVLFVDDNTDPVGRVRQFLEKSGDIRLDTVTTFKQAAEKFRHRSYDVVVSYADLPSVNGIEFVDSMDGIAFLRTLRSSGNPVPVILYSHRSGDRLVLQEVAAGSEVALPAGGELRPAFEEIATLIKGTMLKKKAERETKAQNEQLAAILSATPLGIFQARNGRIEWVNQPIQRILGYDEPALVGKDVRNLFFDAEEYGQATRDLILKRDAAGLPYSDCRLIRSNSVCIPCRIQLVPLDPADPGRGGTYVVTDITEKQQLVDELKESEARYREVLKNSQSIIIRMDTHGTITFCNTFALSFFDYASEDLIGRNVVGTLVHEKSRVQHDLSMMANDLGFNAEGYAVNVSENVRRNGDHVWIAWINKAIRDDNGRIAEILCIGHDITDRKRSGEVRISTESWKDSVTSGSDVRDEVFDAVFHICTEISIEGREGKPVGTTFLIGDTKHVMEKSRQIILNPFEGHAPGLRVVTNPDLRENIKALAQLDGAFVITGDGFVEAVGRYITVDSSLVSLPPGMGTRHNSVAAITSVSNTIGIVVSQSGGGITVFRHGRIVKKITL